MKRPSDDLIEPVVRIGPTFHASARRCVWAAERGSAFGSVVLAIVIGLGLFFALAHGLKVL